MNQKQLDHLADSFKTVAVGQLAFFGYTAAQSGKFAWFAASTAVYIIIETGVVFFVLGRESSNVA
jgi:hypothetical protein